MESILIGAFIVYMVGLFTVDYLRPSNSKASNRIFPSAKDEWTERVRHLELSETKKMSFSRSSANGGSYDNDSSFNEDDFDFHHNQGVYSDVPDTDFDNY